MSYSVLCATCTMSIMSLRVFQSLSSSVSAFIYHHHRFGLARFQAEMKEQPEKGKGKRKISNPFAIFSPDIFNKTRS